MNRGWRSFFAAAVKWLGTLVGLAKEDERAKWTKETSYALVIAADYLRDTCPQGAVRRMKEIFSESAAEVDVVTDAEATGDELLKRLKKGLGYRTFFFYENAHGSRRHIRMIDRHVSAAEIYGVLKEADNRIVGFFDSCYSGSMIETDEFGPVPKGDGAPGGSMARTLAGMLEDGPRPRGKEPMVKLYSACEDGVVTTYEPEIGTAFQDAVSRAWKKTKELTYADFDEKLVQFGSYGRPEDPRYHVVPQMASYGKDFSSFRTMR